MSARLQSFKRVAVFWDTRYLETVSSFMPTPLQTASFLVHEEKIFLNIEELMSLGGIQL